MKHNTKRVGLGSVALAALLFAAAPGPARAQQTTPPPDISAGELLPQGAGGWLGVAVEEVAPEKAQELKMPSVYGVYLSDVGANSPAAKAGLKQGDVITEYDGQRVEGRAEFQRMVRETPPGRTVQLSVWRDGRAQKISAEIGHAQDTGGNTFFGQTPPLPRGFGNRPAPPLLPGAIYGQQGAGNTPALGVSAQDLSGQLGEYFGAPEGEGVLVTEVHKGSAGEKAGLKAGDVIIQVDGQRVHNIGELRDRFREGKSVSLGVLRKGTETELTAEPEIPQPPRTLQAPSGPGRRIPL